MKTILFLGTALLIASPALAADSNTGTSNETAASMNHINIEDPKNPIYDAPSTSTSGAAANSNLKGHGPVRDHTSEPDGPSLPATATESGTSNETAASMNRINTEDPKNPMYDAPSTSTSGAAANSNVVGDGPDRE